jgi:hypothetical protein
MTMKTCKFKRLLMSGNLRSKMVGDKNKIASMAID